MRIALFRFDSPASLAAWRVIDDSVMGGQSTAGLSHDPAGHAVFAGIVSPANDGGFAAVQAPVAAIGETEAAAYWLHVRGDGKRYQFTAGMDAALDGVSYQAGFKGPAGVWIDIAVPVWSLQPSRRGHAVADAPPLDPGRVRALGLRIADRQAGRFRLEISSIELG